MIPYTSRGYRETALRRDALLLVVIWLLLDLTLDVPENGLHVGALRHRDLSRGGRAPQNLP